MIGRDLRAKARWCYGDERPTTLLKTALTDGSFAMLCYRAMQWSGHHHLGPLAMLFNKLNAFFGQCIIGRGAEFGECLVLIHSQGVVINGSVRGGAHVYIEHQVTIGAEKGRSPCIGNHVFIGAGAKIVGAVTIGDHARIGANAVVLDDVPAGATVGGIPARVLKQRDPLTGL
ncbi:MAG TPA: DapH/DapD/GlmU-related protein [Rhodanobacteraceae bacterium]|nr:DapH/DapD/GlmU-related protein [Rhodanobacteraceae bacterium]